MVAVDGTWSGWTTGACSATCGDGTKTSTRTCNGKANGGADCAGSATMTESCNEGSCVFGTDAVIMNDSSYMNNLGTVGTGTNLWFNRQYAVEQLPASVQSDTPYYQQSGMSTEICSTEGGGLFNTDRKTSISICCANHGAANNVPTGLSNVVTLSGAYSISNHGGTPCTYYTGTVEAGSHHVCCATGWASGLFYPVQPSSPPVITRSQSQMVSVGLAGSGTELWWNRNYAIESLPVEVTSITPYYVKSGMSTEICSREGGGLFHTDQAITVSICCANHGAANNVPTGLNNVVTLSGAYSISNHGGTPCTYYQGTVNAGSNHVCCATGWASGVFLPVQAN